MNISFRIFGPLIDVVCICLVCCVPVFSSEPSPRPFDPKILSSKTYSEVYKLSALYDDQTFIQTQMIVTNIGLGDSNAACEILVLHAGERPNKICRRFKKNCWKYSDSPCPTLSIGSCSLSHDGKSTTCVMALDGTIATISLDLPSTPAAFPDTIVVGAASKKFYTNEVIIPWTRLTTTLRLPGLPEKQLQGSGMLEHCRSAGYPKDFSRGWISFYGRKPGGQFLADFHFPAGKTSGAVGWTWMNQDKMPKPLAGLQMAMKLCENGTHANAIPFVTAPNALFVISGQQSLFRFSLIDDLGPILGNIVKLIVGNPVTRFYWAQARTAPGQPPIEGILEIMNFE
jgi:hypothetical protein